jgi:NRAMP (natural resistance-associated macrophage protein)-like metal ion transporter
MGNRWLNPVAAVGWGVTHVVVAAAVSASCRHSVDIQDAYKLLSPTLGAKAASVIFALALLASGQNSTITGTLAGQVVMEGGCGSRQHQTCALLPSTIRAVCCVWMFTPAADFCQCGH